MPTINDRARLAADATSSVVVLRELSTDKSPKVRAAVARSPHAPVDLLSILDDPRFLAPFVSFFDPRIGRPSTPMETYVRLMFLKFRYQLGFESLCREVSDSITWRQFCRIGLASPCLIRRR